MPNLNNLTTQDLQWGTANWSGQGYIDGLKMVWNSATSLSVTSGAAFIPSLSKCLPSTTTLTLSGLVLAASTWYHVYLYNNAGTPAVECVPTAPAAAYYGTARTKTGDTSRRYIGSVVTDASGNIIQIVHIGNAIKYECNISPAPFGVLLAGVATTATDVDCSGMIPTTSYIASFLMTNSDPSASIAYGNSDMNGGLSASTFMAFLNALSSMAIDLLTDTNRNISYMWRNPPSTGVANIRVIGYTYER